jgi:hypothetical protein
MMFAIALIAALIGASAMSLWTACALGEVFSVHIFC